MCFCLAPFPAATPAVTFSLMSYSESLIRIWPKLFFATPCSGQAAKVQGGIQGLLKTVMWWKKFEWIVLFKNDKAIKRHAGHPKGMPAIPSCFIAHTVHFFMDTTQATFREQLEYSLKKYQKRLLSV